MTGAEAKTDRSSAANRRFAAWAAVCRRVVLTISLATAMILTGCGSDDSEEASAQASPVQQRALEMQRVELPARAALGQLLIGRFDGTRPSRDLLRRIRAGKLGGVIFFADNVVGDGSSVLRASRVMQRAAIAGGNPPLLLMVDQEGGVVKRLPGPPTLAPPATRSAKQALRQGRLTGRYLRGLGINVNLAPVVDVPVGDTFIRERSYGDEPEQVARRACAFARGLIAERVAATLKHFPGLGRAQANTDDRSEVVVDVSAESLRTGYAPYRRCGKSFRTLTMVSSAIYPRLTGDDPAVVTPATYRRELGVADVRGVTISDDLQAPALDPVRAPATRGVRAGLNLALYAGTEDGSATAYRILAERIREGRLPRRLVVRRSQPVLRLKALIEPRLAARFLAAAAG